MSAPSEPEKYSIDEMMERLKNRPSEKPLDAGELVTRADGTQAIRVRKSKRRTRQPFKEDLQSQRRARIIQTSGSLILILLALFAAGIAIIFANSSLFRQDLIKKIALNTGASVELQQFRMNPTTANAASLVLTWPEGIALDKLTVGGINAEISPISFLGKSMVGKEANANEGTLTLRIPHPKAPPETPTSEEDSPAILFDHYNIPKFHVLFGDPASAKIRLRDSEATFVPQNPSGRPQLLLTRGNVAIVGWPKLRLDRSHIEFRGHHTDIVSLRLKHETDQRGVFELSGTVSPTPPDQTSRLAVELESYLIDGIAGSDLGHLFSGRIDTVPSTTSNFVAFTPQPESAISLSVTFCNSLAVPLEVTGFPFLFGLSQTLDDPWFAHPIFDSEVRGILRRTDGNTSIEDLNLEYKGRMALRGTVTMAPNGGLSGELEVGIAEGMIKTSGNRRLDSLFGPSKEGFRWITLKIGSNAKSPTDNFKELYDAASVRVKSDSTNGSPSFEELTRPK